MNFSNALILAAGFGTRMLPLTNYVPKPLIMVNEKPLIQYTLDFFHKYGISNISTTYGHKADLLVHYLNNRVNLLINTINQDNAYFLFNSVIKHINEPIIVTPCDLIVDINLHALYYEYIQMGSPALCIVPIPSNNNADYIHSNELGEVVEITRNKVSDVCASGIQIINPVMVNDLINPHTNFYDVWMALINKKHLFVAKTKPLMWQSYDNIQDLL